MKNGKIANEVLWLCRHLEEENLLSADECEQVIDAIEGLALPYHLGNALKYIARVGRKDPAKTEEDLRKAIWYINRYITFLTKQGGDSDVD